MTHAIGSGRPVSEALPNQHTHTHTHTQTSTSMDPFKSRDNMDSDEYDPESQLSPQFFNYLREKTTMRENVHEIKTSASVRHPKNPFVSFDFGHSGNQTSSATNHAYTLSGVKRSNTISPIDGKTEGCNRRHTFDNFVNQDQIRNEMDTEKRVGHGWQVLRALKRVASKKSRGPPKHRGAPTARFST